MAHLRITKVMDAKELRRWHERSLPGEVVIYHTGDLAYDRQGGSDRAKIVDELGAQAWEFARTHELHLIQVRLGINNFEYRGVRTNPRNAAKLTQWLKRPLSAAEIAPIRRSPATPIPIG